MEENFYSEPTHIINKDKRVNWLIAACILLAAAVISLFVITFMKKSEAPQMDYTHKSLEGAVSIAFINSDSLWANYVFVKDKKAELAEMESKFQNQYNYLRKNFEDEYQAYIKKGSAGQLTLAQQKEAEARLGEQQKRILSLDEELSTKFAEQKAIMNQMLLDTILNFIHRYNTVTKYDFIFEYSKISGLFYANDSLDITPNIVNGLNFEYAKWK